MYNIYLKEEDLLKADQFPVIALLNEAANSNIIEFAANLAKGIGSGYNYSNCSFWEDLDEYDQANTPKFDGLLVTNEAGEEIIISYKDLLYYLETLYSCLDNGDFSRLNELRAILDSIKTTFRQDC